MAEWTYKINKDNSVTLTDGTAVSNTKTWGNGDAFTAETASLWADATVAALNDTNSEMIAGFSPEEPVVLRSSIVQVEVALPESFAIESPAE